MYYLLAMQENMRRVTILDDSDWVTELLKESFVLGLIRERGITIRGIFSSEGKVMSIPVKPPIKYVKPSVGAKVVTTINATKGEYNTCVELSGYLYGSMKPFKDYLDSKSQLLYSPSQHGKFLLSDTLEINTVDNYHQEHRSFRVLYGNYLFGDTEGLIDYYINIGTEICEVSLGDFLVKHLRAGIVRS